MQPGLLAAFLLNAGLFGGSYLLLLPTTRRWPLFDRAMSSFVVGSTFLVLMLEALSQFQHISVVGCSIVVVLWFCGGMIRALPSLRIAAVETATDESAAIVRGWRGWPALAAIIVAAWALLYYLMRGLILPVEPVSDGPIYHLPFALRWRQETSIVPVATPFGEIGATYFPVNGDLWLTWLLIGGGDEMLAKVGQWPFAVVCALLIWRLSRRIGADATASVFPAALWSTTLVTLLTSATANVDLLFAAWMLAGVYFVVQSAQSNEDEIVSSLALGSLACGLAIGTKTIGVVFVPPILAGAIFVAMRSRRCGHRLAAVALFLIPAAYSYLRVWSLTGNPLYPLDVRVFGVEWFPGWLDRAAMHRTSYHVPIDQWRWLADRLSNVIDLRIAWLWIVAIGVGLTGIGLSKRDRRERWIAAALVAMALLQLAAYWLVIPYNSQERFLLGALALAIVPLGPVLNGRPYVQWLLAGLIHFHLLTPTWSTALTGKQPEPILIPIATDPLSSGSLFLTVALPISLIVAAIWIRNVRYGRRSIAMVIVAVGCYTATRPAQLFFAQHPYLGFYPRWEFSRDMVDAWEVLDRATGAKGANVAYAGTNLPYYLYGHKLRNRVRYVNVNQQAGWLAHDFHLARLKSGEKGIADSPWPQWYREEANYDAWLANLKKERIEYLFAGFENQHGKPADEIAVRPSIEWDWALRRRDDFEFLGPNSKGSHPFVFRVIYERKN